MCYALSSAPAAKLPLDKDTLPQQLLLTIKGEKDPSSGLETDAFFRGKARLLSSEIYRYHVEPAQGTPEDPGANAESLSQRVEDLSVNLYKVGPTGRMNHYMLTFSV